MEKLLSVHLWIDHTTAAARDLIERLREAGYTVHTTFSGGSKPVATFGFAYVVGWAEIERWLLS